MENSPRINAMGVYFPYVFGSRFPHLPILKSCLNLYRNRAIPSPHGFHHASPSSLQTHLPFPNSPTRPYPAECCSCCWVWSGPLLSPQVALVILCSTVVLCMALLLSSKHCVRLFGLRTRLHKLFKSVQDTTLLAGPYPQHCPGNI